MALFIRSALGVVTTLFAAANVVAWTPATLEGPGLQTGSDCVPIGDTCVEGPCATRGRLRIEIVPATDRLNVRWTPASSNGSCYFLMAYYALSLECSDASGTVECSHVDAYARHSLSLRQEGVAQFSYRYTSGYGEVQASDVSAVVQPV